MAGKSRASSVAIPAEDHSSTRRRIQDVLGQARAALRQSQQFRPRDLKSTNISSRLAFQQQTQEDYWSIIATAGAESQEASKPQPPSEKIRVHPDDGFGLPFREEVKRKPAMSIAGSKAGSIRHSIVADDHISDSSTTMSVNTADLKVTSASGGSSDSTDSDDSQAPQKKSQSRPTSRAKNEEKVTEWSKAPTPILAPHTAPAITQFHAPDKIDSDIDKESRLGTYVSKPTYIGPRHPSPSTTTGKVEKDDLGFSRAHVMNSEMDPHWFEKALLVRGENISEAAYKAFKKAQEDQQIKIEKKEADQESERSGLTTAGGGHKVPMFTNADPEYTADWLSETGVASCRSEVGVPNPTIVTESEVLEEVEDEVEEVEEEVEEEPDNTIEAADPSVISEMVDTSLSMIRTASELECSGIIEEIRNNLKVVLSMPTDPTSETFTRMSPDEEGFAKEFDQAKKKKEEPLEGIYSEGFIHYDEEKAAARALNGGEEFDFDPEEDWDEEEEYENTFIDSATNTADKTVSKGASTSSKPGVKASTSSTHNNNSKRSSVTNNSSKSKGKMKKDSTTSHSDSTLSKQRSSPTQLSISSKNSKRSPTDSKSKVVATTSSSSSRRHKPIHVEHGLDAPTTRQQKNIQTILDKEVYQKELKRIRSERFKERKEQEKLEQAAKESLERNKKSSWINPDYTEILLPELFKYKSVSGLQAAKAKRSSGPGGSSQINYGSPYFQMNGAISEDYGTSGMLAAARVESLDIPDLVREVLASNERMYKMTVNASEQMAKAYKEKVKSSLGSGTQAKADNNRRKR